MGTPANRSSSSRVQGPEPIGYRLPCRHARQWPEGEERPFEAAPSGSTPLLTDSSTAGASADPLAPVKKVTDDASRRASFRPFDRLKNWR
jgi:hypothetical protein